VSPLEIYWHILVLLSQILGVNQSAFQLEQSGKMSSGLGAGKTQQNCRKLRSRGRDRG